jgi:segregation and condensation protein A
MSPFAAPRLDEDLFLVELERFHGPLDLLLHLIRQQDIDILDIPIARITGQFLAAVERIRALDLDRAGEFLEMAATLVRIKAQLLLPTPAVEGEEDPRAELVRRLLEYEQVQEISRRLRATEAERARRFRKGYVPVRAVPVEVDTPLETTWDEVLAAALAVRDPEPMEHRVGTRPVSLEEKLDLILTTLSKAKRVEFKRLLHPFRERVHGVMTLLAGLELTRRRKVRLRQNEPFHELWILRRDAEDRARESEDPAEPVTEMAV